MKLNKIQIRSQNRTYLERKLKCLFKNKRAPRGAFEFYYLYFEGDVGILAKCACDKT